MIVFTATNLQTQDVYVGTARESVEEEWADLLSQAESGTSGQFFQQLREHGAAAFEVDTWAYGESPAEARESMREAKEELGAQPIKSSRGKSAGRSTQAVQSASMKALMAAFEEAMSEEGPLDEDDALEGLTSEARKTVADKASQEAESPSDEVKVSAKAVDLLPVSPESPQSAPAFEARQNADTSPVAEKPPEDEEQKMQARLEAMKAAQARLLRERESGTSSSTAKTAAKPAAPEKLATGRTGSAAKEKRIREAIEAERERRENLRHTNGRDDQAEMNAVMARIEMRRMATKKANAEKAKQAAAARRAKQKAEARKEAAASTASQDFNGSASVSTKVTATNGVSASKKPTPSKKLAAKKPAEQRSTLKLAAGRTGSSAKEKRIKEAIEQEKAARMAEKQAQRAAEAEEMANILARLEARAKEAEKIKRRR